MNNQLGKDAIANSVTLGNNTDILLRAEDSRLLAQDAVALKNQGLTEKNIQLHLEATGASRQFAIDAAFNAEMANRVSSKLEDMRVSVAQNMFATEQVEQETEEPIEQSEEATEEAASEETPEAQAE
jgi:hypothetical protein